jgi:UDP-glucose 4-epimerase
MKILVTGGNGFIGRSVVDELCNRKYNVVVSDNFSSSTKKDFNSKVKVVSGDLCVPRVCQAAFEGVDACIHLASKIGGFNYLSKHPASILSTNNRIDTAVFNQAVRSNIKKLVYVSSGMVFSGMKKNILREDDLGCMLNPENSYAVSKSVGEYYCRVFNKEYGLNYSIARLFNVYGEYRKPRELPGDAHVVQEITERVISNVFYSRFGCCRGDCRMS